MHFEVGHFMLWVKVAIWAYFLLLFSIQGVQEVDQQWIISGAKQCCRHLNKINGLPFSFFLEQTK